MCLFIINANNWIIVMEKCQEKYEKVELKMLLYGWCCCASLTCRTCGELLSNLLL